MNAGIGAEIERVRSPCDLGFGACGLFERPLLGGGVFDAVIAGGVVDS